MKKYDNVYIATQNFELKNKFTNVTITTGEYLQLESIFNNDGFQRCLYNNTYIYINKQLIDENCKKIFDAYQDNFTNLNKNHLYFGQINNQEYFVIESEGKTKYYKKIGQYTTSQGKTYNAVELNEVTDIFDITKKESFETCSLTYFKLTDIIKKDEFKEKQVRLFNFEEAVDVCEYLVNFPRMLEVLECFFTGQALTEELEDIYEKYHDDRIDDIEQGLGFTSHQDENLNDILEKILLDMDKYPKEPYHYFVNYVSKNHVNNKEFDKQTVLKDIENNGYVLLWCNEKFKNDREMVLAAVKKNKQVINFASSNIRNLIGQGDPVKALESLIMSEKFEQIYPVKNSITKKIKI